MNSETEHDKPVGNDPVGFGATLGLAEAEAPPIGRNGSFRARLAQAVKDDGARDPESDRAAPPQRLVAVAAVWALVLGLGGIVVGTAALIFIIMGTPWWFQPLMILLGLIGIGLTVGGFSTLQRKHMPWLLMGAATLVLTSGAVLLTVA